MKYIIGASTGLLKDVDVMDRKLTSLTDIKDQSLDKKVTFMCWSGGYGGYTEDEITIGYNDGNIIAYNYPSMIKVRTFKLPSKCIYIKMLNKHFDNYGPIIYSKYKYNNLYPDYKDSKIYNGHDRLLLSICESGYIFILDWSNDYNMSGTYQVKDILNNNYINEYINNIVAVYKYKSPLTCAYCHTLMTNRLFIAGNNIPPILFDLYTENILWYGKYPHNTLLDLKSQLNINSICILESLDHNIICVSTVNSFLYIYDPTIQKDPVYDFNLCDSRTKGYSKLLLGYSHLNDTNTKHRKTLKHTVNQNYSVDDRSLIKIITNTHNIYKQSSLTSSIPSEVQSKSNPLAVPPEVSPAVSSSNYPSLKGDATPGDRGECDDEDDVTSSGLPGRTNKMSTRRNVDCQPLRTGILPGGTGNVNPEERDVVNGPQVEPVADLREAEGQLNREGHHGEWKTSGGDENDCSLGILPMGDICDIYIGDNMGSVYKLRVVTGKSLVQWVYNKLCIAKNEKLKSIDDMDDNERMEIIKHLLNSRKSILDVGRNDHNIHYSKGTWRQYICVLKNVYNFHKGSITDLKIYNNYLFTCSLDRFITVINIKDNKKLFKLYCNQKITSILLPNNLSNLNDDIFESSNQESINDNQQSENTKRKAEDDLSDESSFIVNDTSNDENDFESDD